MKEKLLKRGARLPEIKTKLSSMHSVAHQSSKFWTRHTKSFMPQKLFLWRRMAQFNLSSLVAQKTSLSNLRILVSISSRMPSSNGLAKKALVSSPRSNFSNNKRKSSHSITSNTGNKI